MSTRNRRKAKVVTVEAADTKGLDVDMGVPIDADVTTTTKPSKPLPKEEQEKWDAHNLKCESLLAERARQDPLFNYLYFRLTGNRVELT